MRGDQRREAMNSQEDTVGQGDNMESGQAGQ